MVTDYRNIENEVIRNHMLFSWIEKAEVLNDIFYNVIKILVKNLLLPRSN
jgi:hypothetical protein